MSADLGNPFVAAPKPWDRQPGETSRAFHGFAHYRDLPAWSRSIDAAFREHREKCEGAARDVRANRATSRWQTWSSDNGWVERAAHYDGFRAEERRRRREQELDDAQDEIVRLARAGLARVAQRLQLMSWEELPPQVLDRWIKTLADVQLKALGYEDRLAVEHSGGVAMEVKPDLSALSDEDLASLLSYVKERHEAMI